MKTQDLTFKPISDYGLNWWILYTGHQIYSQWFLIERNQKLDTAFDDYVTVIVWIGV